MDLNRVSFAVCGLKGVRRSSLVMELKAVLLNLPLDPIYDRTVDGESFLHGEVKSMPVINDKNIYKFFIKGSVCRKIALKYPYNILNVLKNRENVVSNVINFKRYLTQFVSHMPYIPEKIIVAVGMVTIKRRRKDQIRFPEDQK